MMVDGRHDEADRVAARDWAMRSADPDFADWEALTDWLAADPARADLYHDAAAGAAEMAALLATVPAMPVPADVSKRRGWLALGAAIAASGAGLVAYHQIAPTAVPYAVETAAGTTRTIALADGSHIALAGGTRLILDRNAPRMARLERGEALFTVRHDDDRPFRVTVGADDLVDTGTVFDVVREGAVSRVAVAEGGVIVDPDGASVRLGPGDQLETRDGGDRRLTRVAVGTVGGWRSGQLSYEGATLATVAADLSRVLGVSIVVTPAVATRPFRGTLAIAGLRRDPAPLADLLDVRMVRAGAGWELRERR